MTLKNILAISLPMTIVTILAAMMFKSDYGIISTGTIGFLVLLAIIQGLFWKFR
jgi:hypothetical protein